MTRWSNDPPLADEHAFVQQDRRFPRAIHLWACGGRRRITSINSFTNVKKWAGGRTVPVFDGCCVRVPGCSWSRPRTATICSAWRSKHVTEARVHRDVAPPLDSCELGMESSGWCATPSLLVDVTDDGNILLRPVTGLPAVWARDATSQAASVEFPPHMLWMRARRWQMGMPSWPLRRTRTPPFFWRKTT